MRYCKRLQQTSLAKDPPAEHSLCVQKASPTCCCVPELGSCRVIFLIPIDFSIDFLIDFFIDFLIYFSGSFY